MRFARDVIDGRGGGGGTSPDDGDGLGADSDDSDDEDGSDDEEEGKGKDAKASSEKMVSEAKYLQIKKHLSAADAKKAELEKELNALKTKDLPEAEKLTAERDEAVKARDTYRSKYENLARTNAFLTASSDLKISWVKVESALKLADLEDLEIDDDGSVDGIKDAVKALAREHPYLLAPKDSDEEGTNGKGAASKSGSLVGSKNKGKKPEGELSEEDLKKRFPALNR